jgi:hypothetical protein
MRVSHVKGLNISEVLTSIICSLFTPPMSLQESASDPVVVFDDLSGNSDIDAAIILLRDRQPSFTFLGDSPIPKGFSSLPEFAARRAQFCRLSIPQFSPGGNSSMRDGRKPPHPPGALTAPNAACEAVSATDRKRNSRAPPFN